jgi:hypothetical protein
LYYKFTMGLGNKLKKDNNAEVATLASAHQPVSVGGYNATNVPALASQRPAPMSIQEIQRVRQLAYDANAESYSRQANAFGLVKPHVPTDGIDSEISALVTEKMWRLVCLKNWFGTYTQSALQQLVDRACRHDWRLIQTRKGIPSIDMTCDLAVLGLCDIILFIDDSGSMSTREPSEDNMTRWEVAKQVVQTISDIATMMDSDGIVTRFFNNSKEGNGLSSAQEVANFFDGVSPSGGTPLGTKMRERIINGIVRPCLLNNELQRPVLVMTITDGEPTGSIDEKKEIEKVLIEAKNMFRPTKYGEFGISFSFSQIGVDPTATAFLGYLDTHPVIGNFVDCTSAYTIEKAECGPDFTESAYLIKLMIGAIDPAYDASDEQGNTVQTSAVAQPVSSSIFSFPWSNSSSSTQPPQQQQIPVVQAQPYNPTY